MKTSASGRALIERFEGLILQAYDDDNDKVVHPGQVVKGTLTIGYGHTSAAGPPKVYIGQTITKSDADAILAADLSSVEIEVGHLIKVPLTQNEFDALVSFQFNTGALGHAGCSVTSALNAKQYDLAASNLMKYDEANGRVMSGLVTRRKAEKALFLTPVAFPPPPDVEPTPQKPVSLWASLAKALLSILTKGK